MRTERPPAVAGSFYPAEPGVLERDVRGYVDVDVPIGAAPKALIVPHAGYIYSGPVAGLGYRRLRPLAEVVRRVVLIGPAHRVPFRGIATTGLQALRTPLGPVPVDLRACGDIADLPQVLEYDEAHAPEHSLEVHLPFLQIVLDAFSVVPLLAGDTTPEEVAEVLARLWGADETVIVVSSDLSHYHDHDTATALDLETAEAIERMNGKALHGRRACGHLPIRGLLDLARRRGLEIERVDLRTSGDTAGPRDHVVGYGTWVFTESPRAA